MDTNSPYSLPTILVLDDEEVQRMTVHLQLKGMGKFVDFSAPEDAIAYLQKNDVDAAIVDIRMPTQTHDGLWFLSRLREFDRVLGVVLRTADEDIAIAQAGIEARAVQRVIKSQPGAKEALRSAVTAAVSETRERREIQRLAGQATDAAKSITSAIGRADDQLTVAAMSRGFIEGLTSPLTALIGYSELLLKNSPSLGKYPQFHEMLERNRAIAQKLSGALDSFLENPYLDTLHGDAGNPTVEQCVTSLEKVFAVHPMFSGEQRTLVAKRHGFLDAHISANGTRVLTALRHLVEYCAMRSVSPGEVVISASVEDSISFSSNFYETGFVKNGRRLPSGRACVFAVTANMPDISKALIEADLSRSSVDATVGNLLKVATTSADEQLVLSMSQKDSWRITMSLIAGARA